MPYSVCWGEARLDRSLTYYMDSIRIKEWVQCGFFAQRARAECGLHLQLFALEAGGANVAGRPECLAESAVQSGKVMNGIVIAVKAARTGQGRD
jgi:hypothetical protein